MIILQIALIMFILTLFDIYTGYYAGYYAGFTENLLISSVCVFAIEIEKIKKMV